MGTLKNIGYGVGKYLTTSDAVGIPDIGINRTNTDLLNFKVATNNAYALYNFKDGMLDAYQTSGGVDASASTNEVYDSDNKYYYGQQNVAVTATGGTITTDGDYTVHKFTASGTFTTDTAQDVEYLVVGGGGGSGCQRHTSPGGGSGGGGAGGYRAATGFPVSAAAHSITVGSGGPRGVEGSPEEDGTQGGSSIFSTITSAGGGGGGTSGGSGKPGGSGGGGGSDGAGGSGNTPSTTPVQGYDGGTSGAGATAAGGGGASAVGGGAVSSSATAGAGGAGIANDIVLSGTPVTYAGGGGGGKGQDHSGSGGPGGAGGGGDGSKTGEGVTGTANTGGGGGGSGGGGDQQGAPGGSGIVVIRRPTSATGPGNLTLVSNAQTAQAAPTTGRLMIYEEASTGSVTLNTDLKGYVSRDNGTTYTQVTLADDTTYETGKRLVSGSVDISGQPSGTNMKYKIETLNQSATKVCRLHGASLLWA